MVDGAEKLGLSLPEGALLSFCAYFELLESKGSNVNLTTVTGASNIATLHFLDSIALLKTINFKHAKVIDIGSGAGFPGVPLKIAEPTIDLTLLDSSGKRISFLNELCGKLGIEALCVNERAEQFVQQSDNRENWDVAVSRAVARLNALSELCLPYVSVGGYFISMKSKDSDDEINEASSAFEALGAKLISSIDYMIPGTEITHRAVLIKKISETPAQYPRRYARIQKSPL